MFAHAGTAFSSVCSRASGAAVRTVPRPPPRLRRPLPPGSASGPAAPLAPAPWRSTRWPSSTHPQTSRPLRRATVTAMLAGSPPPRPPDGHARRGQPGERGSLQAELPGPLLLFCLLQPMVSLSCRPRVSCLDRIVSFYKLSRRDPDAHVTVLREQVSKERVRVKHGRGRGPNAPEPTSLPEEGDVPVPLPTCGGGAAT